MKEFRLWYRLDGKEELLRRGAIPAKEVVAGGLELMKVRRNSSEKGVAKQMTDGELGQVRQYLVGESAVVNADHQLGKKGKGVANGTARRYVVAAKEREGTDFCLKLQMKQVFNEMPVRIGRGGASDDRVVSRNENWRRNQGVLAVDDGEIVVGVVIVSSGFASQSHACQRTKLSGDIGLEVDVEVDEMLGNAQSLHLQDFKDNGFTMLALIKGGVVVGYERRMRKMG